MRNLKLIRLIIFIVVPSILLFIIILTNLNRNTISTVDNIDNIVIIPSESLENKTFAKFINYDNDIKQLNLVTFKVIKTNSENGCLGTEN